jgi:hypothetical protein
VELFTSLPDPPLFGLIATFARLLWPVATAAIDLHASPDCWNGLEESCDELEDVNCGRNAYKCGNHVIPSPMNNPTLAGSMLTSRSPFPGLREGSKRSPRGLKSLREHWVLEGHGFSRAVNDTAIAGCSR